MTPKKKIADGQIVHFVATDGRHRTAVVTHIWSEETVNLYVFPDASFPLAGDMFTSVTFDEAVKTYSWHWIEKV